MLRDILYALLGIVLIMGSVWSIIAHESLYHRAERTNGTILEVHQGGIYGSDAWFEVEFRDYKGEHHRAKAETGGEFTSLRKGDSIELLYDPRNPSNIRSPKRSSGMLFRFVLFAVGVGCIVKAKGHSNRKKLR
jgi:hypothetical protein